MEMKMHSTVSVTEFSVQHSGFQDTLQAPTLQNTVSPDEKTPMAQRWACPRSDQKATGVAQRQCDSGYYDIQLADSATEAEAGSVF